MHSQRPLAGSFLIVGVGIALGLGYNSLHPQPLAWIGKPKTTVSIDDLSAARADSSLESESRLPAPTPEAKEPSPTAPEPERVPNRGKISSGPAKVAMGAIPGEMPTSSPKHESPPVLKAPSPTVSGSPDPYSDLPQSEYPIEIDLAKAKEFYDRSGLLVLDAREVDEYAEGHIQSALSAPADAKSGDLEWLDRMAKDPRPILVYCGGGECELSLNLGFELTRSGHRRVLILKDGFPSWKDAGYPVAEGETP